MSDLNVKYWKRELRIEHIDIITSKFMMDLFDDADDAENNGFVLQVFAVPNDGKAITLIEKTLQNVYGQ